MEGQVPDLPALRLQQVPVFPTVALTQLRISLAPAADKPTTVQWKDQVTQKGEKGKENGCMAFFVGTTAKN